LAQGFLIDRSWRSLRTAAFLTNHEYIFPSDFDCGDSFVDRQEKDIFGFLLIRYWLCEWRRDGMRCDEMEMLGLQLTIPSVLQDKTE
jgi:hypothetical protein